MDDPAELMVDSDSVLDEGSFTNEDECTVLDRAAWVIDGTSGFGERELTGHPETDGVWFVENVDAYLTEHIYDDTSLTDLIEETIRHVVSELEEEMSREMGSDLDELTADESVSMHEFPGATIAIARWNGDTLEYYSLGDSSVIVRTDDDVHHYNEEGPQRFDAVLEDHIATYLSDNPDADIEEVREYARPHIRESRKYREVPGGFWCLGVNPLSASHAVTGEFAKESVTGAYLFTDGLLSIVEKFGVFDDWASVADHVDEHGVDDVLSRLRTVQSQDGSMLEYPRLKPMDDVAIIHLDFDAATTR